MKPKVSYSANFGADRWMQEFERVKAYGEKAKVTASGTEYSIDWINEDPPWVRLTYRDKDGVKHRMVRCGDVLMLHLQTA